MKLWIAVSTGLLATLVGTSGASAQWSNHHPTPPPPASDWQWQAAHAADELASEAAHMSEMLAATHGYSRLTHDALALSSSAAHLRYAVRNVRSRRHAVEDFRPVAHAWRRLADGFGRSHEVHHALHLQEDWAALTHAFLRTRDLLRVRPTPRYRYGERAPYVGDRDDDGYVDEPRYQRRPYRPRRAPRVRFQMRIPG